MKKNPGSTHSSRKLIWGVIVAAISLVACASSAPPASQQQVVVAPIGAGTTTTSSGMTREELEDHVRRFADRYITRVALAANHVRNESDDADLVTLAQRWKAVSYTTIVDIAIGPNAVTNLLDMMTVTRLSRILMESYWVPEVFGPEFGEGFLQAYIDLEADIWLIADDVLTQEQQQELKDLIDEYHAKNPDQIYPWYVKMSDFSGQRAASLAAVQQSGGMLQEVARAREAAEEIQAFGERVLFYLQRAPMITSAEFGTGASDVLRGPEMARTLDDMNRFVTAVERITATAEALPEARLEAIEQFMEHVGEQRAALVRDIASAEPELGEALAALLPVMESLERTVVAAKTPKPGAKPFVIGNYTEIVREAAVTAEQLRLLVDSLDAALSDSSQLTPLIDKLVEAENAIVDRAFMQAIALILIFFAALLGYKLLARRLIAD